MVDRLLGSWSHIGPSTRHGYLQILRRCLKHIAEGYGGPREAPGWVPSAPKPEFAPRDVSLAVINRMKEAAVPWMRLAICLCSDLALRSGTAWRVAGHHLSADGRRITIKTKNGRVVEFPLTQEILDLIALCPERSPGDRTPFIVQLSGRLRKGFMSAYVKKCEWQRLCKRVGMPISLRMHDLRHAAAKRAERLGGARAAQHLLGHTHPHVTEHYLNRGHVPPTKEFLEQLKKESA